MREKVHYISSVIYPLIITLIFISCIRHHQSPFNTTDAPLHNTMLKDITTQMTSHPDSALKLIIAISDTLDESRMTLSDYYEYQILITEALFKNKYLPTNDSTLHKAVEYYDSMVAVYPDNIDLQYQQARAYYYKGTSEDNKNNTVETCSCYLKALEIMETLMEKMPERKEFEHFIALTYNRLGEAYLYNESPSIAIECLKNAISHFNYENKLYAITINNKKIGELFYKMSEYDSAMFYLKKADSLCDLGKPNPFLKRNIHKSMAMVLFSSGRDKDEAYNILYQAMSQPKDSDEQMVEYFSIGSFYYEDQQYDSALYYLEKSFPYNEYTMFYAANLIVTICKITGDKDKIDFYSHYFTDAAQEEISKTIKKTEVTSLYEQYKQKKLEKREQYRKMRNTVTIISLSITAVIICFILLLLLKRRKKIYQEELSSKDFFIKTMSGKVKKMSDNLKDKDSEIKSLKEKLKNDNKYEIIDDAMFEEKMQTLLANLTCANLFEKITNTNVKVYSEYPELLLSEKQQDEIIRNFDKVFDNFSKRLLRVYSSLNKTDIIYCCLFFIGLDEKHVSVLMGKDFSTVWRRSQKLQKIFDSSEEISHLLRDFIKKGRG